MSVRVWAVCHVVDALQAAECARQAADHGCHGVMLIAMNGDRRAQVRAVLDVAAEFGGRLSVGSNFLGMSTASAVIINQALGAAATWSDEPDFHRNVTTRFAHDAQQERARGHAVFAAVGFKGQPHDDVEDQTALLAAEAGFVPTTSGPMTGVPPDVEKVRRMRQRLDQPRKLLPLALASGVTPGNLRTFAPYLTDVLVGTSIIARNQTFDERRLRSLMDVARTCKSYVDGFWPTPARAENVVTLPQMRTEP